MPKLLRCFVVVTLFGIGIIQRTAWAQSPYVGEIRIVGSNFAPVGWASCDGQLLAITQNEVLFQLIGTTYGGDGQSTFALPDLRGRIPMGRGQGPGLSNRLLGESRGHETFTLTVANLPPHTHRPMASGQEANSLTPNAAAWGTKQRIALYSTANPMVIMSGSAIGWTGGGQPADNMAPYQALHYIISLFGIYPTQ